MCSQPIFEVFSPNFHVSMHSQDGHREQDVHLCPLAVGKFNDPAISYETECLFVAPIAKGLRRAQERRDLWQHFHVYDQLSLRTHLAGRRSTVQPHETHRHPRALRGKFHFVVRPTTRTGDERADQPPPRDTEGGRPDLSSAMGSTTFRQAETSEQVNHFFIE